MLLLVLRRRAIAKDRNNYAPEHTQFPSTYYFIQMTGLGGQQRWDHLNLLHLREEEEGEGFGQLWDPPSDGEEDYEDGAEGGPDALSTVTRTAIGEADGQLLQGHRS